MGSCQSREDSGAKIVAGGDRAAFDGKRQSKGVGDPSASSTHPLTDEVGHGLEPPTTGADTYNSSGTVGDGRIAATVSFEREEEETTATTTATTSTTERCRWHEKPGYSSGASSGEGSDRFVDPLHLRSMRNIMLENGDLTQNVVRLETPFGIPITEIYDGVHDGAKLGEGVAGIVRKVRHKATGVEYACKVLDIGLIDNETGLRQLRNEISIMCQLDHPNIVRIEEVYESANTIYLLQELCTGGELYDRLDLQPDLHYTEAHCARLIKQMVSSVRYIHSKGVIHRDLKLENFLFSNKSPDSELKMIDFGLSKHFTPGDSQSDRVGTNYTCAPEILKGSYDEKCDIWALGVITYMLLCGDAPFGGCYEDECLADVVHNILSGDLPFEPADIWEDTSDLSKRFVKRLLNVNPEERPTAKEVQRDEWLQTFAAKDFSCEPKRLNPRIVAALVNFKGYSEMRRLLSEVISFTLLPEQIVELREEFQKIDTDNDGEITLVAMKDVLINTAGAGALGGITEAEVEDIFNSLKVNKTDSTVRWHEFIAAGLSQCKVDNRNLQLAFDRLDIDRKGYIVLDDLKELLGHSPDTLESIKKMWEESMHQCKCKMDRITFEDFVLLMKGQSRRESYRPSMVWSPKRPLIGPEDQALLEELAEDSLDDSSQEISMIDGDSCEKQSPQAPQIHYLRKRSKSFDDVTLGSDISLDDPPPPPRSRRSSLPANPQLAACRADCDSPLLVNDGNNTPLLATREQYKNHRDLRTAILEASKNFDSMQQARRQTAPPLERPTLIMRRGSSAPKNLEDLHQKALFDAAVRRGGRQGHDKRPRGHRKKRTQSDITGLLNAGIDVEQAQALS